MMAESELEIDGSLYDVAFRLRNQAEAEGREQKSEALHRHPQYCDIFSARFISTILAQIAHKLVVIAQNVAYHKIVTTAYHRNTAYHRIVTTPHNMM